MRVEVLPKSGTVCEAGNSLWSLFSGGHSSKKPEQGQLYKNRSNGGDGRDSYKNSSFSDSCLPMFVLARRDLRYVYVVLLHGGGRENDVLYTDCLPGLKTRDLGGGTSDESRFLVLCTVRAHTVSMIRSGSRLSTSRGVYPSKPHSWR